MAPRRFTPAAPGRVPGSIALPYRNRAPDQARARPGREGKGGGGRDAGPKFSKVQPYALFCRRPAARGI